MTQRTARVAKNIKEELAWMLEKGEIKDPRIGFVTITAVKVSTDLRECRVYFSLLGSKHERSEATKGLESASGFIRTELGRRLRLKHAPEVEFKYDETVEASARISKVLYEIHEREAKEE